MRRGNDEADGDQRADLSSLLLSLWGSLIERCALFWLSFLEPRVNETEERSTSRVGAGVAHTAGARATHALVTQGFEGEESVVSDESFLSQLEQRTQQVKITLANLEAEKVRIEGLIARLQPLVPHYDALLAAEQSIREANVSLEPAQPQAVETREAPEQQGWTG